MLSNLFRFHGRRSLGSLFRQGKSVRRKSVSLKFAINPRRQGFRCAVVVGKKVSKSAPVRNRIRRRIYEIVRVYASDIPVGADMAFFIYDEDLATMPAGELEAVIIGLITDISS